MIPIPVLCTCIIHTAGTNHSRQAVEAHGLEPKQSIFLNQSAANDLASSQLESSGPLIGI